MIVVTTQSSNLLHVTIFFLNSKKKTTWVPLASAIIVLGGVMARAIAEGGVGSGWGCASLWHAAAQNKACAPPATPKNS